MVVRELVHLVSFKLNEASVAAIEAASKGLGEKMSIGLTLPILAFGHHLIKVGTDMQTLKIAIDEFATSAQEGETAMNGILKAVTNMPTVTMNDVAQPIAYLLNQNVKVKDLVQTFTDLEMAVGATGGNFNRAAKDYAEVLSLGNLRKREANQLITGGKINVFGVLEDYMHKSRTEITELVHAGKISAQTFTDALHQAASAGGHYFEIMDAKRKTLMGGWKTLQDVVNIGFTMGEDSLFGQINKYVGGLLFKLSEFAKRIASVSADTNRFIMVFLGIAAVVGPVMTLWKYIAMFVGPLKVAALVVTGLALAIDDIMVWMQGGNSVLGHLFGDFKTYEPYLILLKTHLKQIGGDLLTVIKDVLHEIVVLLGQDSTREFLEKGFTTILKDADKILVFMDKLIEKMDHVFNTVSAIRNKINPSGAQEGRRAAVYKYLKPILGLGSIPEKEAELNKESSQSRYEQQSNNRGAIANFFKKIKGESFTGSQWFLPPGFRGQEPSAQTGTKIDTVNIHVHTQAVDPKEVAKETYHIFQVKKDQDTQNIFNLHPAVH